MGKGFLRIELFTGDHTLPVSEASVFVKDLGGNILYRLKADKNGLAGPVELDAPDILDKRTPTRQTDYFNEYDVEVPAFDGYKKVVVHHTQIFDRITSILPIHMEPAIIGEPTAENTIDIHVPHDHGVDMHHDHMERTGVEQMDTDITRATVTTDVAIPQYITVHLGSPNAVARNVRVPFKDYIKNVASSEIFPWWEESALYANIYAQITFTLNRVFTYIRRYR